MKRILSVLILASVLITLVFSMTSCGKSKEDAKSEVLPLYEQYCKTELGYIVFDGDVISYSGKHIVSFNINISGHPAKNEFRMLGTTYFIGSDYKSHAIVHSFDATYDGTGWKITNFKESTKY